MMEFKQFLSFYKFTLQMQGRGHSGSSLREYHCQKRIVNRVQDSGEEAGKRPDSDV